MYYDFWSDILYDDPFCIAFGTAFFEDPEPMSAKEDDDDEEDDDDD